MSSKTMRIGTLLAVVALLASACGDDDDAAPTTPAPVATTAGAVAPTAAPGFTQIPSARIGVLALLNNLDPALPALPSDAMTKYLAAGHLFRVNDDFTVNPELAESFEWSNNGLTATVVLKEGLVYSDGTPVTADDVVFMYERNRDLPGLYLVSHLSAIDSVVATDARTVVFSLSRPDLDLPSTLGHAGTGIHPRALVESDPDYFLHPVSAGPYVLVDWTPGATEWVLEENPNYVRGPMAVKQLVFRAVADQTSRVLQLGSGELDYVADLPVAARDSFPDDVSVNRVIGFGQHILAFNSALPDDHPLRNTKVRQAISFAVNRQEVSTNAFDGVSTPSTGLLWETAPEGLYGLFGDQDLDAARALLAETPFAGGFTVELQTWGERTGWTDAALVVAQHLAEIGIIAEVTPLDDAVAVDALLSGGFEMQFSGNSGPPMGYLNSFFGETGFWGGVVGFDDPDVKALIAAALAATTVEDRIAATQEAQRLAFADPFFLTITDRATLAGNRLPGILYEANLQPGKNVTVATLAEMSRL